MTEISHLTAQEMQIRIAELESENEGLKAKLWASDQTLAAQRGMLLALRAPLSAYVKACHEQNILLGSITGDAEQALNDTGREAEMRIIEDERAQQQQIQRDSFPTLDRALRLRNGGSVDA